MRWPFATNTAPAPDISEQSASPSRRVAFKLFQLLRPDPQTGNIFFSPASVMLCLWLLFEGASGETRDSFATILEVAGWEPEALRLTITTVNSALKIEAPSLLLECANSVWCDQQFAPRSEYLSKIKQDCAGEIIVTDFRGRNAVLTINSWVSARTHDKIRDILSALDPQAVLVAINAVYFKDFWSEPFEREFTREDAFETSDGRKLTFPLMNQYGSYAYYEESKFQAVRLRYKTSRLSMYVFLPTKRSNLQEFQNNLSSATWDKWMRRFETMGGHIRLPRFKITYDTSLKGALQQLGMGIAFDPARARFDAITPPPPPMWVDQILHRAFVELNEEGTEAAAVTRTVMLGSSMRQKPTRTFEMIVDHPFFFAICDDQTSTILFMGSVEVPGS